MGGDGRDRRRTACPSRYVLWITAIWHKLFTWAMYCWSYCLPSSWQQSSGRLSRPSSRATSACPTRNATSKNWQSVRRPTTPHRYRPPPPPAPAWTRSPGPARTNSSSHSRQITPARRCAPRRDPRPPSGSPATRAPFCPGGQLNPQFALQLQSLARNGKKIQAIKLLRQATHSDLLTAKNFVDRL